VAYPRVTRDTRPPTRLRQSKARIAADADVRRGLGRSALTPAAWSRIASVRYQRLGLAIEISLVLSYMGEEYVATELVSEDGSGSVRRTQIGSGTAHTGYQMRHAWTGRLRPSGAYSGTNLARTAEPYAA
jgi:hypothetical protein